MTLTAGQLNRATLARQLLLAREPLSVLDAVRRIVAVQAQEPASPYLALWNRVAGFDPAELDAAFAEHAVVKATLLRMTLHAVAAEDYPSFHAAMVPMLRAARVNDARFTSTGLTIPDVDALQPHLLEFARRPRSNADIEAMLRDRLGEGPQRGVWLALRVYSRLVHAPTGGPWAFGFRPAYVAARPAPHPGDRDDALRRLVRRYLAGFGPASVLDIAQFTKLARTQVRAALAGLTELAGPDGSTLYDVPGGPLPAADTPAPPRLMAMWDSVLLAYADRGRVIPPAYRAHVIRTNGDVLPTVLVDGLVAGVWRPAGGGIEVTAFHPLSDVDWTGLAAEARSLLALLADREPDVHRRHTRWWAKLPAAETRVLG